jgi:hypothetical protein
VSEARWHISHDLRKWLNFLAVAQGLVSQARIFGGTIGVAMSTIVFNGNVQRSLSKTLTPAELEAVRKSPAAIVSLSLLKQNSVRLVFAKSFDEDMRICTYVAAASLVVAVLSYRRKRLHIFDKKAQHDARLGRGVNTSTGD